MLNKTIYKHLKLDDKFNVAFPDERIPNGFIDKGKTRLGITYTCFHDNRHTIGVIPGQAIIKDALADYPYLGLFEVMDGVAPEHIEAELNSGKQFIRIVTTPHSFWKIIRAAINIGKLQWLYDNFFLYLDEVHCYATEMFQVDPKRKRSDILTPFDEHENHVWKFKDMAMGSATPFKFSDPRILAMQHYKIVFEEKFGTINIVHDHNPQQVLCQMLTQEDFPGNIHVFYNSVTQAGEILRQTGITDAHILCALEERNMKNLDDMQIYFREQPIKGQYAKFNFYSSRYNEGWDLDDDETATIILLTDVHLLHTIASIPYKGFQAVGRSKVTPHKIFHITNSHGELGEKDFESIQVKHLYNAKKNIKYYNHHLRTTVADGMEDDGSLLKLVWPYSFYQDRKYQLSHMRVDQFICKEYCNEHYNNLNTIEQTWQSCNYNTKRSYFDFEPLERVKITKEELNKQVIERVVKYRKHPERYNYQAIKKTMQGYRLEFQILFEALDFLSIEKIEEVNYNDKAMKEALIQRSNNNAEAKIRFMLVKEFRLKDTANDKYANRYTQNYVKQTLRRLYDELGMKNPNGKPKTALAKQLVEYGLFELNYNCKVKGEDDKWKPGVEILKENFNTSSFAITPLSMQTANNPLPKIFNEEYKQVA
jgi:hypothetical protein